MLVENEIDYVTRKAKEFLAVNYGMELKIPILRNNRYKSRMGVYFHRGDAPLRIEIAGFVFKYAANEALLDTLYHELVHYALHTKGLPNNDGDEYFEKELKRMNISSTHSNIIGPSSEYTCSKCGKVSHAKIKDLAEKSESYITPCCKSALVNVRERILNGTEAV